MISRAYSAACFSASVAAWAPALAPSSPFFTRNIRSRDSSIRMRPLSKSNTNRTGRPIELARVRAERTLLMISVAPARSRVLVSMPEPLTTMAVMPAIRATTSMTSIRVNARLRRTPLRRRLARIVTSRSQSGDSWWRALEDSSTLRFGSHLGNAEIVCGALLLVGAGRLHEDLVVRAREDPLLCPRVRGIGRRVHLLALDQLAHGRTGHLIVEPLPVLNGRAQPARAL